MQASSVRKQTSNKTNEGRHPTMTILYDERFDGVLPDLDKNALGIRANANARAGRA